jgi:hypothetical protein
MGAGGFHDGEWGSELSGMKAKHQTRLGSTLAAML